MSRAFYTHWGYVHFDAKLPSNAWCEPSDPNAVLTYSVWVDCPSYDKDGSGSICVLTGAARDILPPMLTLVQSRAGRTCGGRFWGAQAMGMAA